MKMRPFSDGSAFSCFKNYGQREHLLEKIRSIAYISFSFQVTFIYFAQVKTVLFG